MNGFVSKLYDIDSIEIPEEMLKVCVDEKYGDDAIVRLSLNMLLMKLWKILKRKR